MDNFNDIITPLLNQKYRIKNHSVLPKPKPKPTTNKNYKPVITPLGQFESVGAAAEAHNITSSTMCVRLKRFEGYHYA